MTQPEKSQRTAEVPFTTERLSCLAQQLAQMLGISVEELRARTPEEYIQNVQYGWLYRLLFFRGPETDGRMDKRVDETSELLAKKKDCIAFPVSPILSGESTSWTFTPRLPLLSFWNGLRAGLITIIEQSNHDQLIEFIHETREIVHQLSGNAITMYRSAVRSALSLEKALPVYMAGSGTDAFFTALELFGITDPNTVSTTGETGTEISNFVKKGNGNLVAVRRDASRSDEQDKENSETNVRVSDQEVANQYISDIENGKRVICFTLCTKTGIRLDVAHDGLKSALDLVAEYVDRHNAQHVEDPIYMIADAVQLAGRIPFAELVQCMTREPFVAGFHSCSKGPGGVSHIGALIISAKGEKVLQLKGSKGLSPENRAKRQVVWADNASAGSEDLLMQMRVTDNIAALWQAEAVIRNEKSKEVLQHIRNFYTTIFERYEFHVLQNDVPMMIAMEPPSEFRGEAATKNMLQKFAAKGITFGGFLKERTVPTLRFGISLQLLEMVLEGRIQISNEYWNTQFAQLEAVIKEVLFEMRKENLEKK